MLHTSRQLFCLNSKRNTQQYNVRFPSFRSGLQTSATPTMVQRPSPYEADDPANLVTKAHTQDEDNYGAAIPTSTQANDERQSTRLPSRCPQRGNDDDVADARSDQGRSLGFHLKSQRQDAQMTREVNGLLKDISMEWRCVLGCHHRR
jgi:hypothetical protein